MINPARRWKTCAGSKEKARLARYGFYEAIDYTPERLPQGQNCTS